MSRTLICALLFVALAMCSINGFSAASASDKTVAEETMIAAPASPAHLEAETHEKGGHDMTHKMKILIMQLAVVLVAAKFGGFACKRWLKIPEVLGELGAGILIGPYCLGSLIGLFQLPEAAGAFPVTAELYGFATFASVILLYLAGLETDLSMFMKYSIPGFVVGIGGVVVSFVLGVVVPVMMGVFDSFMEPGALFMGAISTATSVGITARILSEKNKLDSAEGTTILAGAVIDDVLGIIVLAVIIGIADVAGAGGAVKWSSIGVIAAKAFGFWVIATAVGMLLAVKISKVLEIFGSRSTMATVSLGLACLLAGLAEQAGLAMIIGAYIMGLSMSRADSAKELYHQLEPVYNTVVAVFFCVLGMMVNIAAMKAALVFGLVYTVVAIIAKILGCGLPSMFLGFNPLGAFRIGVGMLPRGEVALIVAGIGLARGLVSEEIFGVAIMMTLFTTLVAPLIMVRIFDDRSGLSKRKKEDGEDELVQISLKVGNIELGEFVMSKLIQMFHDEECYVHQLVPGEPLYQIRKEDISIVAKLSGEQLVVSCKEKDKFYARLMLLEVLACLTSVFSGLREIAQEKDLRTQVV